MSQKLQAIILIFIASIATVGIAVTSGGGVETVTENVRSVFEGACARPVTYRVATYDERFGISRAEFEAELALAAEIWNEAAGKTVIVIAEDGDVAINLLYGERQAVSELGQTINAEQQAYANKRKQVEDLRDDYSVAKQRYESSARAFTAASEAYEEDVQYWNDRGGAPPGTYEELAEQRRALERQQREVNQQAANVNAIAQELNVRIDELNVLAQRTNAKVDVFNHAAGDDFDQGTYISDKDGERINIYEFTNRMELRRVLAHEFGHALGIGHVENPESIMYSYNVGETFELSAEDIAALRETCELE
jgi:hypothetical protein